MMFNSNRSGKAGTTPEDKQPRRQVRDDRSGSVKGTPAKEAEDEALKIKSEVHIEVKDGKLQVVRK